MNLHYLATILFLASSASEAKNLRFEKPEHLIGGLQESQTQDQNNDGIKTRSDSQIRILKSSDDYVNTFNAVCVLPQECDDIDVDELEEIAEDALKGFNSESYDECSLTECPPPESRWCCYSKSGDNERFGTVLDASCNSKRIEKDLEDEMSSAHSRSKRSKRVRVLRRLGSGLSTSPDDANFNMACFRASQVNTRSGCEEEVDYDDVVNRLASALSSGSSFDFGGRRLSSGETNVVIAEGEIFSESRCFTSRSDPGDDEFNEDQLIDELIQSLQDEWDN